METSESKTKIARCRATKKLGGNLVAPCFGLKEALNERYSRKGGLTELVLTRLAGRPDQRILVVIRSGQHTKKGLVANFCPFCGRRLYARPGGAS